MAARIVASVFLTNSGALVCGGSSMVGSPDLAAAVMSGFLCMLSMTLPFMPMGLRPASSALYCAIASGVGVGTGRCIATRRFFASWDSGEPG